MRVESERREGKVSRPVMMYHGGKWQIAPWIISHFPPHRVYVEPYGGAGSVLMRKPGSYAEVYNDLDSEVVNVFRVLRNPQQAAELERLLRLTPFAREEFAGAYEPSEDPVERARRMIVTSFLGFGADRLCGARHTGFRANSNRSGTTPAHDWMHYPRQVRLYCARLAGVCIESRDAKDVIRQQDSAEALIYCDPP